MRRILSSLLTLLAVTQIQAQQQRAPKLVIFITVDQLRGDYIEYFQHTFGERGFKLLCQRIRNTPAQAELPWRERKNNIRGAFRCETPLANKTILLVDDVMTTGASLNECARTFKRCGAAAVILLVLARALPE